MPIFLVIITVGLISYLLVSATAPFGGGLFGNIYLKPPSQAAKPQPSSSTSTTNSPMSVTGENIYFWTADSQIIGCLGNDSVFYWEADGSLNPGESYTFVPKTPLCAFQLPGSVTDYSLAENRYFSAQVTWSNSQLELSSNSVNSTFSNTSSNPQEVAQNIGNIAHLCGFPLLDVSSLSQPKPVPSGLGTGNYATINSRYTIKNVGNTIATNIKLKGANADIYPMFYYRRCMNADFDRDGFNDSLENVIGTDFSSAKIYPPDVTSDGIVDQNDVNFITQYIGQGTGQPLAAYNVNSGALTGNGTPPVSPLPGTDIPWSRIDLNGDGYIDQTDVDIDKQLIGPDPSPGAVSPADIVAPTIRILSPGSGATFTKGSNAIIKTYAWDNLALTKVEFYANGNLISNCTLDEQHLTNVNPNIVADFWSRSDPLDVCNWSVPKSGKTSNYIITTKAYDNSGNSVTSAPITISAQ